MSFKRSVSKHAKDPPQQKHFSTLRYNKKAGKSVPEAKMQSGGKTP